MHCVLLHVRVLFACGFAVFSGGDSFWGSAPWGLIAAVRDVAAWVGFYCTLLSCSRTAAISFKVRRAEFACVICAIQKTLLVYTTMWFGKCCCSKCSLGQFIPGGLVVEVGPIINWSREKSLSELSSYLESCCFLPITAFKRGFSSVMQMLSWHLRNTLR